MKPSTLFIGLTAAAASVRWADDAEVAILNANLGETETHIAPSVGDMQPMEVERMFNITPGLIPIDKMREIWKYHGQNVDEDGLLQWFANSTEPHHPGEQRLAVNKFIRAGLWGMFLAFSSDAGATLQAVFDKCYGAVTKDGTATGKDCGDKLVAALVKAGYSFVIGGTGHAAVLIQGRANPNDPDYELQNQTPQNNRQQDKRSADQACPNHNRDFNGFYGVRFRLGSHIGAKLSGIAPCGKPQTLPTDGDKGSFGYQINRAAADAGSARVQFYTIQDGSRANIFGGSIVYETQATDTCPEYISFDNCEE